MKKNKLFWFFVAITFLSGVGWAFMTTDLSQRITLVVMVAGVCGAVSVAAFSRLPAYDGVTVSPEATLPAELAAIVHAQMMGDLPMVMGSLGKDGHYYDEHGNRILPDKSENESD